MSRKNKIDLNKQLSEFYSTLDYKPISANAISIYLILLQIDCKTDWLTEFRVANTILMSKIKGLSISSLQRARNELINNQYILYKKGVNQNDASTYSIIKLYFEQANEQPNEQPNEQADELPAEHINTTLDLFFNFIINKDCCKFQNISSQDKQAIIYILKKLDLIIDNMNTDEGFIYMPDKDKFALKIQCYCIKEVYFSPYRVFLKDLTRERFLFRFEKAKKYINPSNTYKFLNYFIKCVQEDFYKNKKEGNN